MSTISTATPVIIGASGVQGSTGVTGTGSWNMGAIGLPLVSMFSTRFVVTSQSHCMAKHWWQLSYDMSLYYMYDEERGQVEIARYFLILGFRLFRRRKVSSGVPLIAVTVFAEQPA